MSPPIGYVSRTRWTPDGRGLIFGRPGDRLRGRSYQEFVPGKDASTTRRPISSLSPTLEIQTWAVSPDGKRIIVSVREISRGLVIARHVPGVKKP